MNNDLLKYMSERFQRDCSKLKEPGPVITISREYGCPAKMIAEQLADVLTRKMAAKGKNIKWRWISKEILTESAKQLNTQPDNIKYVFDYEQRSIIDDILQSHSQKYYKSDRKIRNTIANVIRNISCDGHVIIVGRGGVAITKDILKSLHINLEAPLEWRSLRISEKNGVSIDEAKKMANEIDAKRKMFREYFEGKDTDYTRFDLTFNCMTLSSDEIIQSIVRMAEIRGLI